MITIETLKYDNHVLPQTLTTFVEHAVSAGVQDFNLKRTTTGLTVVAAESGFYLEKRLDHQEVAEFNSTIKNLPFGPGGRLGFMTINERLFAICITRNTMTLGKPTPPRIEIQKKQ